MSIPSDLNKSTKNRPIIFPDNEEKEKDIPRGYLPYSLTSINLTAENQFREICKGSYQANSKNKKKRPHSKTYKSFLNTVKEFVSTEKPFHFFAVNERGISCLNIIIKNNKISGNDKFKTLKYLIMIHGNMCIFKVDKFGKLPFSYAKNKHIINLLNPKMSIKEESQKFGKSKIKTSSSRTDYKQSTGLLRYPKLYQCIYRWGSLGLIDNVENILVIGPSCLETYLNEKIFSLEANETLADHPDLALPQHKEYRKLSLGVSPMLIELAAFFPKARFDVLDNNPHVFKDIKLSDVVIDRYIGIFKNTKSYLDKKDNIKLKNDIFKKVLKLKGSNIKDRFNLKLGDASDLKNYPEDRYDVIVATNVFVYALPKFKSQKMIDLFFTHLIRSLKPGERSVLVLDDQCLRSAIPKVTKMSAQSKASYITNRWKGTSRGGEHGSPTPTRVLIGSPAQAAFTTISEGIEFIGRQN